MAGKSAPGRRASAAPATDRHRRALLGAAGAAFALGASGAFAFPNYPVTPGQRGTAQQFAHQGVALSELAPGAPERYQVKRGDTLWDISGLYLLRPWHWPKLWGMNLEQISNPHLIFPGQVLVLTRRDGRAWLGVESGESALPTLRLSPRVRSESLADAAIPAIPLGVIAPFLNEALIVEPGALDGAARLVASSESRVLVSRGDRAYARGQSGEADRLVGEPLSLEPGRPRLFRVFRSATPLRDPDSGELLGHEAREVGKAELVRGETLREVAASDGSVRREVIPATVEITQAREEMRIGDRLLPEPPREVPLFVPRAPDPAQSGKIVSVYGNAVRFAGQNQVVAINRGARDGMARGHVLALLKDSGSLTDSTDAARTLLRLPGERNGLMMVFKTFERVSYALVLQISDGVKVGDEFVNP